MNRPRKTALFLALVILGGVRELAGQELQIGIIRGTLIAIENGRDREFENTRG